jgi:hypothetical protein
MTYKSEHDVRPPWAGSSHNSALGGKFQWTKEAHEAFKDLKKYLTNPTHPSCPRTPWKLAALHIYYNQRG